MNLNVSISNLWRRAHKLYFIDKEEKELVRSSLTEEQIARLIEEEARKYFGVKYVIFTPSGRAALELALRAIGASKEDEIITQAYQCHEIPLLIDKIAKLKYADVEKNGFNVSARTISKALTKKTRAVVPVNLYGFANEARAISALCKKKKIVLIEDCAHSFGSEIGKKKSGTFGDVAIFSFCKNLASPSGGLLITRNKEIYEKASILLTSLEKKGNGLADLLERKVIYNMNSWRNVQKRFPFVLGAEKMQKDSRGENYFIKPTRAEACVCLAQIKKIDSIIDNYSSRYVEFYNLMKKVNGVKIWPYKKGMNCLRFPILFDKEIDVKAVLEKLYSVGAFEPSLNYKGDYDLVKVLDREQTHSENISNRLIVVALDNLETKDLIELNNLIEEIAND